MGINIGDLINEIQNEYRSLKKKWYPGTILLGQFQNECYRKNNLKAARFRHLGDGEFMQRKYRKAVGFYTRCIALAMEYSEELILTYVARSTALFCLGQYEQCLADINRVIDSGYPLYLVPHLLVCRTRCLAQIPFASYGNRDSSMSHGHVPNTSEMFKNSLLPSASSKIKLSYDEIWGRHLLATEDIEPGEILSRQEYFSAILELQRYYTHCSYCFKRWDALIPCPTCSMMMYCSKSCRALAFQAYHRIECKMWRFYEAEISYDQDILLAMRTLYVGTEQGAQLEHLTKSLDIYRDIFKEKVVILNEPFKSDYLSMLRIHLTFEKPSKKSILLAIKAVIFLQHSSFFKCDANRDMMSQTELFATLALLNHMSLTAPHCYKIGEVTLNEICVTGQCTQPLCSLVNHSCYPNVTYVPLPSREQILLSSRPIKRGEQIFISYCRPFACCDWTERTQFLSHLGFTCHCEACKNNWPSNEALVERGIQMVTQCEETRKAINSIISGIKYESVPEIGNEIESYIEAVKYNIIICNNVRAPCIVIFYVQLYVFNSMFWIWGRSYRTDFRESDNIRSHTKDVHDVPTTYVPATYVPTTYDPRTI